METKGKVLFKMKFLFVFCAFVLFFPIYSKPNQFTKKLFYAYLFIELEKYVKERDNTLNYNPHFERKESCTKTEVFYQNLPWDKKGAYPAPFLDIKVICKPSDQKIILVVGDSITAGAGLEREKTYPNLLNQKFQNTYFINAGINGSNTYHWRKGGVLFQKIVIENKDYLDGVILLIGGNNILFIEHVLRRKAKPIEVVPEILALIQELKAELPNIPIYVGNYPMAHVMSPEMYQALEEIRTNTFGVKEGPAVYSIFENRWDLYMKDYLHLNEEGQKLLASLWEEHLKKDGWK